MTQNVDEMLKVLQKRLIKELKYNYPEYVDCDNLVFAMQDIFSYTGQSFIVLIDEWDCLFREYKQDEEAQRENIWIFKGMAKGQSIHRSCLYDRNSPS